ncbi:MAG: RodZ domain-containing protein [Pseudomonadota bacterium]|nr:RodZ domain-containing protein [Pseudomonadota bacterium]
MARKRAGLATKIHSIDEVAAAPKTDSTPVSDSEGLGADLQRARLARGLSLADVSASLRLRAAYLEAIENDRREALPGPVYANGYVRSYAAYLGMDPDATVRRFKKEAGDPRARPELVFPSPAPEGRVPGGAALLVGLVLLVTVYGGWYYLTSKDYLLSDLVPDVPARLAHLMEPAAETPPAPQQTAQPAADNPRAPSVAATPAPTPTLAVTPPTQAAPTQAAPTQAAPIPAAPSLAAAPEAAPVAPPARTDVSVASVETSAPATTADLSSAATTPEPEGRAVVASVVPNAPPLNGLAISAAQATPSAANMAVATDVVDSAGPGRIVVEALAPAWVRLRRPDGDVLLSKVMGRGEKFTIPDHPEVLLSTGDAGSVAVFVDGARVADVGGAGQILEDVTLVADRLAAASGDN